MVNTIDWEPVPSYRDLYHDIYGFIGYYYNHSELVTVEDQLQKLCQYNQIRATEILAVILLAVFLTWLRYTLTRYVFNPSGQYFQLTKINQSKMPESAWKFFVYCFTWLLTFYVSVIHHNFFQKPSTVWDGWDINAPVPTEIYVVYILQTSFYLHSLYTTAFVDVWRKDSVLLLVHHLVTLCLLAFSHAFRYNNIGVLVLLFHDIDDILLEFSKLNVYFKLRGQKEYLIHEMIATVSFVTLAVTWFFSRIYFFPLKALYSAGSVTMTRDLGSTLPLLFFMNAQLWVLFAMNLYWFSLIVIFMFKVVTGQIVALEDTREYDIDTTTRINEESLSGSALTKTGSVRKMEETVQNGVHHNGSFGTTIRART